MIWLDAHFRDKRALVTGASSGIGRATALALGKAGAHVALVARRRPLLDDLAAEIEHEGGRALALPADVGRRGEIAGAVAGATERLGGLDLVVNNAGLLIPAPVTGLTEPDLERMLRVNLFGSLAVMQDAVGVMRGQPDGGVIVNVDSLAGRRGFHPVGGYCATKFALVGLTEALRMELRGTRVHVGLVLPGLVETPMVDDSVQGENFGGLWPSRLNMDPAWVVWAIFATARFRLVELAVPPGAATLEKRAALAPGLADSLVHWTTQASRWLADRTSRRPG
jgi:NAD(P)-dependent dehydrogenase (short-subunit alcohol dehydrogenase family)